MTIHGSLKIRRIAVKKYLIRPVLAAALFVAACGDGTTDVDVDPTPSVRFFNAVWNAPDGIGLMANGQFAAGSAVGYGQSAQSCAKLSAGNTEFGIGLASPGGTGLSSAALASLSNQFIPEGGNYTVLAGGNVIHPSVILLDNKVLAELGNNQAAVRFVNLAASAEFPFSVLKGTAGVGTPTVVQNDITFRGATPFSNVTSGSNAYTIVNNGQAVISGNDATLNLQAGTVNTVVIVRDPATNNFQLRTVQSCS
jgi:hypothetical protein